MDSLGLNRQIDFHLYVTQCLDESLYKQAGVSNKLDCIKLYDCKEVTQNKDILYSVCTHM